MGQWKAVKPGEQNSWELYDLDPDISEEHNIAADHAFVLGPYMQIIGAYKKSLLKDPNPPAFSLTSFDRCRTIRVLSKVSGRGRSSGPSVWNLGPGPALA